MNILAIDTSNQVMGVAVWKDGELKAEYTANMKRNHSVGLMPSIDHIMRETNIMPSELDRIAVAKGPGSYTGVRIGLATAKTMAWTLQIPIVSVSSLELLAHNVSHQPHFICPFFDARRGLVYTGLYQAKEGHISLVEKEQNILLSTWLEQVREKEQPVMFLSQDMSYHRDTIVRTMGDQAIFPSPALHIPRPGVLAYLATFYEIADTHALTPNYIRLVEAEANWLKEQERKQNG
ncbi:tRNA (adenosine(37)-N6)-threonylcarbamoyltransferase complex dimerization subunit type 1 TsaB [Gracilibacillus sp. YIM 98692]|uniref:tRNA (adenosine(37)-N6)-threonylcarbamoyltransferase complex dimerization subunit type 1 TsaB n=1 Tax=Gracilibacillus sp. YIM 98692 TaxID=2663532 RepID=UPI0013D8936B|nr:tRNA (adenosine(37)-N6)-threonylcarbamoyltransferase complex dimerization subunit type 1 TsaB [Gracilibacillus sp. YIM 98692]